MRVVVKSFGCSTNYADGSVLAGCLSEAGYEVVDSVSSSDVVVYNTCAVKGPTEDRILALAERVPAEKKLIIVGCLPLINRERIEKEVRFDGLAGPAIGEKIVAIVNRVAKGEKVFLVEQRLIDKPGLYSATAGFESRRKRCSDLLRMSRFMRILLRCFRPWTFAKLFS